MYSADSIVDAYFTLEFVGDASFDKARALTLFFGRDDSRTAALDPIKAKMLCHPALLDTPAYRYCSRLGGQGTIFGSIGGKFVK